MSPILILFLIFGLIVIVAYLLIRHVGNPSPTTDQTDQSQGLTFIQHDMQYVTKTLQQVSVSQNSEHDEAMLTLQFQGHNIEIPASQITSFYVKEATLETQQKFKVVHYAFLFFVPMLAALQIGQASLNTIIVAVNVFLVLSISLYMLLPTYVLTSLQEYWFFLATQNQEYRLKLGSPLVADKLRQTLREFQIPEHRSEQTDTPAPADLATQVQKLHDLHEAGALTATEFEAAKKKLLA
jgi:hypothetical protein